MSNEPKPLHLGAHMRIVEMHSRAEKLLIGADQHALIEEMYSELDGRMNENNIPASVHANKQVLSRDAIDVLTGVASRMANAKFIRNFDLLEEATHIMRVVDAAKKGGLK